jgi:hypothetical protein
MFALRVISIFCCGLMCAFAASSALSRQSRIENRTDNKESSKDSSGKKSAKAAKGTVWNLDGGVFFATDGHLPNGSCFRLSGHMTAPIFFDGLRRIDNDAGTVYLLRDKPVMQFPDEVFITLRLRDYPCSQDLRDTTVRPPLTEEIMSALRLHFYWKDGVAMRPVEGVKRTAASAMRLQPFSTTIAGELPQRFQWTYAFTIPSEGVPLTDDLVLIIENEEHKIAARTAARL